MTHHVVVRAAVAVAATLSDIYGAPYTRALYTEKPTMIIFEPP